MFGFGHIQKAIHSNNCRGSGKFSRLSQLLCRKVNGAGVTLSSWKSRPALPAPSRPRSPAHPHPTLPGQPERTHCFRLMLLQETSAGVWRGRKETPPEAKDAARHTTQRQRPTGPGRAVKGCVWLCRWGGLGGPRWIRPRQVARAMFMRLVARLPDKPE